MTKSDDYAEARRLLAAPPELPEPFTAEAWETHDANGRRLLTPTARGGLVVEVKATTWVGLRTFAIRNGRPAWALLPLDVVELVHANSSVRARYWREAMAWLGKRKGLPDQLDLDVAQAAADVLRLIPVRA